MPSHRRSSRLSILLLTFLFGVTCLHADQVYRVKRGETAFEIARRFGVSLNELAERNGLPRSLHVYAGQKLFIPGLDGSDEVVQPAKQGSGGQGLPREIQNALKSARVAKGRWKYIVIHHSAVDTGTVQAMERYHRDVRHMENGLAYHFVIGNGSGMRNGEIAVGHRWTAQLDGGHLASEALNRVAIGICLVGNFDQHAPTAQQLRSLKALVEGLLSRCKLDPRDVKTHQQINTVGTRCPGARFPFKAFMSSLARTGT